MQRIAKAELSVASEPINAPGEQDLLARELLGILPDDGGSLTNRAARALIAQRLGRMVSSDAYFRARDQLLRDRVIGRVRGQGGSVFRLDGSPEAVRERSPDVAGKVPDDIAAPPEATGRTIIAERDLMFATQRALIREFPAELDLPPGSPEPIVEDISTTGPKTGIWARPDFVMVCVSRFSILPGFHVETHVFELKNETGGGVRAVHEALAQGRFANFAHLVWHVPDNSPRAAELDTIGTHCSLHGVGLIRMRLTPSQEASLEVLVEARRTATSVLEVDGFLEARLSDASKSRLFHSLGRSTGV